MEGKTRASGGKSNRRLNAGSRHVDTSEPRPDKHVSPADETCEISRIVEAHKGQWDHSERRGARREEPSLLRTQGWALEINFNNIAPENLAVLSEIVRELTAQRGGALLKKDSLPPRAP